PRSGPDDSGGHLKVDFGVYGQLAATRLDRDRQMLSVAETHGLSAGERATVTHNRAVGHYIIDEGADVAHQRFVTDHAVSDCAAVNSRGNLEIRFERDSSRESAEHDVPMELIVLQTLGIEAVRHTNARPVVCRVAESFE